jgi:opacity protein-like surface antigen
MRRFLLVALVALVLAAPAQAHDAGVVTGRVYEDVYWFGQFVERRPAIGATVMQRRGDEAACLVCRRGPARSDVGVLTDGQGRFRLPVGEGDGRVYLWAGRDYGIWFSGSGWETPQGGATLVINVQAEQAH